MNVQAKLVNTGKYQYDNFALPLVVGVGGNVEPLVLIAVASRRLLVVWSEEVAAAALMHVGV